MVAAISKLVSVDMNASDVIPTRIGHPKCGIWWAGKKEFFGYKATSKSYALNFNYPIEHGVIKNWDDMEKIWDYLFTNQLKVNPKMHDVLITDSEINPKVNKEKIAQIMFETFKVPALFIPNPCLLALISEAKCNGIVVDSGDGVTQCVPIFDGFSIKQAIMHLDLGGRDLTEYMEKLLEEIGQEFKINDDKKILNTIKEKICYVANDFDEEIKSIEPFDYKFPDGNHIIIKNQRIRCPEALFKPEIIDKKGNGIALSCYDSIQKCDNDIKKILYNFIFLSGGTSMFNGLPERFTKEIKALAPESMKKEVKVIVSPGRK